MYAIDFKISITHTKKKHFQKKKNPFLAKVFHITDRTEITRLRSKKNATQKFFLHCNVSILL